MKKRQTAALVGYVEAIDFFSVSIPSYRSSCPALTSILQFYHFGGGCIRLKREDSKKRGA